MHERDLHALVVNRRKFEKKSSTDSSSEDIKDNIRKNNLITVEIVFLLGVLPPCIAANLLVGYLAINMKLTSLRLEVDNNLIGVTGENYQGWDCHFGVHPNMSSREIHLSCVNSNARNMNFSKIQGYYQRIISIP